MERKTLFHRSKLMGLDVSDAITMIITSDRSGLPLGITKSAVATQLITIANTDDNGVPVPMSKSSEKFAYENFLSSLLSSRVFQAGYEIYERQSRNPVVPVTDYFFNHVYAEEARECLEAMSDIEIMQSLPRRTSPDRDENDDVIKSEAGDWYMSGKVAGVVVFPANSHSTLLRTWLERRAAVANGQMEATAKSLENARPGSAAVGTLRERMAGIKPAMNKALPTPPRK
jgi:hypothetical protein